MKKHTLLLSGVLLLSLVTFPVYGGFLDSVKSIANSVKNAATNSAKNIAIQTMNSTVAEVNTLTSTTTAAAASVATLTATSLQSEYNDLKTQAETAKATLEASLSTATQDAKLQAATSYVTLTQLALAKAQEYKEAAANEVTSAQTTLDSENLTLQTLSQTYAADPTTANATLYNTQLTKVNTATAYLTQVKEAYTLAEQAAQSAQLEYDSAVQTMNSLSSS